MDLYQLKTFFVLSKIGSFTETANSLYITQSAVSHAIKKLENSLNTKLVFSKGKSFELTEAGKVLKIYCERIFSELEKAQEDINYFMNKVEWDLHIGANVEFGTTILMKHIKNFLDDNSNINLDFLFSHHLKDPLMQDKVDFIIDCKKRDIPGIEKIELFTEEYTTIASPDYLERNPVRSVSDLGSLKIISLDKDMQWWQNFLLCFESKELPIFKNIMKINHIRGIINAAVSGIGIGFVPKYTVLNEFSLGILVNPLPYIRPKADIFSIYIKTEKLQLKKNRLFIDYIKNIKVSEFGSE